MKQKAAKKQITTNYFIIKEVKDASAVLNVLRETSKSDIYVTFNKIMSDYEEGDIKIILVSDTQPIVIQQLALFCSYHSIDLYLIRSGNILKTIFNENVKVIGVKNDSQTFKRIKSVLDTAVLEYRDIYEM